MKNIKLNDICFKIEFEFSKINGKTMTVDIVHNNTCTQLHPENSGIYYFEATAVLPNTTKLIFSGKNNNTDTIIKDDKIIDDLYVKITNIWLDNIEINHLVLCKCITLETDQHTTINSNYIGFNGCVNLHFDQQNIFDQYMSWERKYI
jgi:hypothetical protein